MFCINHVIGFITALQETSDESEPETPKTDNNSARVQPTNAVKFNYPEENIRLSRSSISENCSSPINDQYDDFRPGFDDNDVENAELSTQPSFQDSIDNSFYNKNSKESDKASNSGYSETSKQMMGFKLSKGFEDNDTENGEGSMRPSFQDSSDNLFYNKNLKELDEAINTGYSEISKRMMSHMGYKRGKGLGKNEHGRIEPVEASTQKGRRGLGLKPSVVGDVSRDFKWSPDEAKPEAKEEVVSWNIIVSSQSEND